MPKLKNWSLKRNARKWHFHFLFQQILPYNVFMTIYCINLNKHFHILLKRSYSIKVLDPNYTEQLVIDYWQNCIK